MQVYADGWMVKQNSVYTYNGIIFSLKKEVNPVKSFNIGEPWEYYAK